MSDISNVTIIGHSSAGLNDIENLLQDDAGIDITRKLLRDGAIDPFEDLPNSDVLVIDLGENWEEVLGSVANRARRNRTPIILIGADGNTKLMRAALKAGARDFQVRPLVAHDLQVSIHQLANESLSSGSSEGVNLAVIMSAKGGAGASAITAAVGHALKIREPDCKVLLVDLDLQYGNLPLYFDQSSTTRLTQALLANERMDETLLDSCLLRTDEGIDMLAAHSDQVFSSWEIPGNTVSNLLNLICDRYDYVVFDIPRQIDPLTFQAVERAASISIVMQQTLCDLRFARQIVLLLRDQGLSGDKMRIIVNRHDKRSALRAIDVSDAFDGLMVTTIPNDFKRMSFATDNAIPLARKYGNAPISTSIKTLTDVLFPPQLVYKRGLFGRKKLVVNS